MKEMLERTLPAVQLKGREKKEDEGGKEKKSRRGKKSRYVKRIGEWNQIWGDD